MGCRVGLQKNVLRICTYDDAGMSDWVCLSADTGSEDLHWQEQN